jgi:hypothetical protein
MEANPATSEHTACPIGGSAMHENDFTLPWGRKTRLLVCSNRDCGRVTEPGDLRPEIDKPAGSEQVLSCPTLPLEHRPRVTNRTDPFRCSCDRNSRVFPQLSVHRENDVRAHLGPPQ